ncbi:hypothetical protein [Kitasatospora sp. GAS204B]|uniref:hypothetical protein n=1 Tax=unclassified Kitasatospora TaxID=2633591 RepID=UPI002477056F|nr:hypothetical protein [Kitasatospora sp. GAS204B]MDH6119313.1 hypothetical protein [Kitasatospora sp. GAS204B]
MRTYVGDQEALTVAEFEELTSGFAEDEQLPDFLREMLFGRSGESGLERAVRVDAARGILADLSADDPELVLYAATLLGVIPLTTRCGAHRPLRTEPAA